MFRKKYKGNKFLALDIGTESVKALIFQKTPTKKGKNLLSGRKDFKNMILGHSIKYFEKYGVFDSNNFEKDVLKNAILKAIREAYRNFIFLFKEREEKKENWAGWPTIISLSPDILKARIFSTNFLRKGSGQFKISRKEEKNTYQQIIREAKEKISLEFSKRYGILPIEIEWLDSKIIQIKIDGYLVPNISGYKGKNLEIKILGIFLAKDYLLKIKRISDDLNLNILKIVHNAETLPFILKGDKKDGLFIDIGGEYSQLFLVKNGFLEDVGEFEVGGKMFSRQLADTLGIDEETARNLKEKYSQKLLSNISLKRIKEILDPVKKSWYQFLKDKIEEINSKEFFSSNIFLFGGGSLLPEIKDILRESRVIGLNDLPRFEPLNISVIRSNNIDDIEDATESLKNPQYTPLLLNIFGT